MIAKEFTKILEEKQIELPEKERLESLCEFTNILADNIFDAWLEEESNV